MSRICVFGDLHGKSIKIPEADAYLLTGDISGLPDEDDLKKNFRDAMSSQIEETIKFLKSQNEQRHINRFITSAFEFLERLSSKGKPVYFVSGNREVIFKLLVTQLNPHLKTLENRIRELDNVRCIDSKVVDILGNRVLGIPFVPSKEWYLDNYSRIPGFNSKFEQLRQLPERMRNVKSDIVLSHCPAFGILDEIPGFGHLGIKSIRDYIDEKKPRFFFCGHIHEGTGIHILEHTVAVNMGVSHYVFDI